MTFSPLGIMLLEWKKSCDLGHSELPDWVETAFRYFLGRVDIPWVIAVRALIHHKISIF